MAKSDEQSTLAVPIRLGAHGGARKIAVRAVVDHAMIPSESDLTVWGRATPSERVGVFLRALRDGVPKLSSGHDGAAAFLIVDANNVERGATVHYLELSIPPMTCAELSPLATLLQTGNWAGVREASIEEITNSPIHLCGEGERAPRPSVPAFPFARSSARDRFNSASLTIEFVSELRDDQATDLERWVTSWFSLVEAGAFFIEATGLPSYGYLTEAVDPYPDIRTFHSEQLAIDDAACVPLLQRLDDVHRIHPIKKATLA